jgi:hypothetical protein
MSSIKVIEDEETGYRCLYNSQTMIAYGDIFYNEEDISDFLEWLQDEHPYNMTRYELSSMITIWRAL